MQKQGLSFVCPITSQVYTDPWLAEDGETYEKYAIEAWIKEKKRSISTGQLLNREHIRQNKAIKQIMAAYHGRHELEKQQQNKRVYTMKNSISSQEYKQKNQKQNPPQFQAILMAFTCPLKRTTFRDPVTCADGYTYQKKSIQRWFRISDRSPLTNIILENKTLVPNKAIKRLFDLFTTQDKKVSNLKKPQKQFMTFITPLNFETIRRQLAILNPEDNDDEVIQDDQLFIKQQQKQPIVQQKPNIDLSLTQCANFIPRPNHSKQITQALSNNNVICVVGQAGIGKTQLAYNYLQTQSEYKSVFVNCSSASSFMNGIETYLGKAAEKSKQIKYLMEQFYSLFSDKCIILLDDVENESMLKQFLPNPGVQPKLLITSRSKKWSCCTIEVDKFSDQEALQFVKLCTKDHAEYVQGSKDVSQLNALLGGIPLALFHAMTYIRQKKFIPIQQYCEEFKKNEAEMLEKTQNESSKNIYANLLMTILSLKKENNQVELVMVPLAYMPPQNINREHAIQYLKFINKDGQFSITKIKKIKQIFKKLNEDYSLLQKSKQDQEVYKINSLVQSVIRLIHKKQATFQDHVLSYLNWIKCRFIQAKNKKAEATKQKMQHMLSQLVALSNIEIESGKVFMSLIQLLLAFYNHTSRNGHYSHARICTLLTKKLSASKFGEDSVPTQLMKYMQGSAEANSGNYQKALELMKSSNFQTDFLLNNEYKGSFKQYDIQVERLVTSGIALNQKGLYKQSFQQYKKAEAVYMKFCPNDQVRLNKVYKYMAQAYGALGQLAKHREMLEKALAIEEKHSGKNHTAVAQILTNLALVYGSFKLYKEQKSMFERCLKIQLEAFGEDNIQTCITLQGLATAEGNLDNNKQKKILLQRVIKFKQRNFPSNHNEVFGAKMNYANCLQSLGMVQQAKAIFEQIIPLFKVNYGSQHQLSCLCLANYAKTLSTIGNFQQAEKLCNSVLKIMKKKGANQTNDAVRVSKNVLDNLKSQEFIHKVQNINKNENQAIDLIQSNKNPEKGIKMLEEVIDIVTKVVGPNHESLISTYNNLAVGYGKIGKLEKKRDMLLKCIKINDINKKENDEIVGNAWQNLAGTYRLLGFEQKSLQAFQKSSSIFHKCLGPFHMKTISSYRNQLGSKFQKMSATEQQIYLANKLFSKNV